ncbi:MAG: hypothetical protein IK115_13655 [Lachnospiraceae bacterium]|nr:hypothetical protein [Lachnospiraceae bacterium]
MKKNRLFILIIIISLLLGGYGFVLEGQGYQSSGGDGRHVALALRKLGGDPMLMKMPPMPAAAEEIPVQSVSQDVSTVSGNDAGKMSAGAGELEEDIKEEELKASVSEDEAVSENEIPEEPEEPSWPPPFITVDDSYFDDAVFIGDSRMVGVSAYSGITNGRFLARTSMNIFWMLDTAPETDNTVASVRQGLMQRPYGKIYLLTGINECGTATDYWIETYRNVIAQIREMQPDALIYVHAVTHVSAALSASNPTFSNAGINEKNVALRAMADELHLIFLDINEAFDDENGCLPAASTWDGVHPTGALYPIWKDYLLSHAVEVEGDF